MDYEELRRNARRGDKDAAAQLESQARERDDERTLLVAWSVLYRARFTAWKALAATLRAVGLNPGSRPMEAVSDAGINTTARIRDDVVARALVDACEKTSSGEDKVATALLAMAKDLLHRRGWEPDMETAEAFMAKLDQVLFAPSGEAALAVISELVALVAE